MADAQAMPDLERLPWLTEAKAPARRRDNSQLLPWAAAAIALVAGASYWLGMNSAPEPALETQPSATVWLPEPVEDQAVSEARPAMPQVEPVAVPKEVKIAPRREVTRSRKLGPMERAEALPKVVASQDGAKGASSTEAEESAAEDKPLTYWPASESEGAAGRVVRIGTFSTRLQAKRAWWKVVKAYPGMRTLKAVVAPAPSLRNGRTYYRLQFGTTSQAHSEVLCQRMRIIRVSCAVVGLSDQDAAA